MTVVYLQVCTHDNIILLLCIMQCFRQINVICFNQEVFVELVSLNTMQFNLVVEHKIRLKIKFDKIKCILPATCINKWKIIMT